MYGVAFLTECYYSLAVPVRDIPSANTSRLAIIPDLRIVDAYGAAISRERLQSVFRVIPNIARKPSLTTSIVDDYNAANRLQYAGLISMTLPCPSQPCKRSSEASTTIRSLSLSFSSNTSGMFLTTEIAQFISANCESDHLMAKPLMYRRLKKSFDLKFVYIDARITTSSWLALILSGHN